MEIEVLSPRCKIWLEVIKGSRPRLWGTLLAMLSVYSIGYKPLNCTYKRTQNRLKNLYKRNSFAKMELQNLLFQVVSRLLSGSYQFLFNFLIMTRILILSGNAACHVVYGYLYDPLISRFFMNSFIIF